MPYYLKDKEHDKKYRIGRIRVFFLSGISLISLILYGFILSAIFAIVAGPPNITTTIALCFMFGIEILMWIIGWFSPSDYIAAALLSLILGPEFYKILKEDHTPENRKAVLQSIKGLVLNLKRSNLMLRSNHNAVE